MDFFSSQPALVEKAVTIQMLGVGFPIFTIGILIASYYGAREAGMVVKVSDTLKEFMKTPVFISFVIGIALAFLLGYFQVPGVDIFNDIFTHFFTVISLSLSLFVWFAIGLMLRPVKIRYFLPLFLIVVGVKLFFEPLVVSGLVISVVSPFVVKQILLLDGAMPSGAIAAVIASRYGCDRSLAGWIVVGTTWCPWSRSRSSSWVSPGRVALYSANLNVGPVRKRGKYTVCNAVDRVVLLLTDPVYCFQLSSRL